MTRIALLMLAALLPRVVAAQPANEARFAMDLEPGHGAWRVSLGDAQYAALRAPNFSDVQVLDPSGEPLDWALCVRTRRGLSSASVPVMAVPVAGRAQLDVDGRITLRTGAGFRAREFGSLVLDTRAHGNVRRIIVPGWQGRSVNVRASPNLQQWSNRLAASVRDVDGHLQLDLSPQPANFVRIDPDSSFAAAPAEVTVEFEDEGVAVETAWYTPPSSGAGVVHHVRALPVRAARVAPEGRVRWTLESRDREGNPWKPRATGTGRAAVEFSALNDGFWRVKPELPGFELGHAAYELRVASDHAISRAILVTGANLRGGARLSCDLERWNRAGPARFVARAGAAPLDARGDAQPTNFRTAFLVLVGVIAATLMVARLIIRRARR